MRLIQPPSDYHIDTYYGRVNNIVFTTKQYKDRAIDYFNDYPIISIDEPESDQLEKLYPIGSIYINKSDPRNPKEILGFGEWTRLENTFLYCSAKDEAKRGGSETTTLQVENIPEHQHEYTPKGTISEENLDHTHVIKKHKHPYTPKGEIKTGGSSTNGFWTTKLAAFCTPVVSSVDGDIFTIDEYEDKVWSTGEPNKWSNRRKKQKIVLNSEALMKGLSLNFEGTKDDTDESEELDSGTMSKNAKHNHTFTGTKEKTEITGSTKPFNNMPPYVTVIGWVRII